MRDDRKRVKTGVSKTFLQPFYSVCSGGVSLSEVICFSTFGKIIFNLGRKVPRRLLPLLRIGMSWNGAFAGVRC